LESFEKVFGLSIKVGLHRAASSKMPRRETLKEIKKRAREDRLKIRKKVQRKYGSGPFSKDMQRLIRKEVDKKVRLQMKNQSRYQCNKIKYERGRVRMRLPGYPIKGVTILASKLIHHFKPEEIRRAALKYLKLKERFRI